jgi:iron complex outermembrane receptor protein
VKTHSFSRLHQALLVAGSFSCGGLTSVLANAEDETAVSKFQQLRLLLNLNKPCYIRKNSI